jgi:hypothetical protein
LDSLQFIYLPYTCSGNGNWGYYDSINSESCNNYYNNGFYFDFNLSPFFNADGDPSNDFGDVYLDGLCSWQFIWKIKTGGSPTNSNIGYINIHRNFFDSTIITFPIEALLNNNLCSPSIVSNGILSNDNQLNFTTSTLNVNTADSIKWWFSDGSSFNGSSISKIFNTPGLFQVCLGIYSAICNDTICSELLICDNETLFSSSSLYNTINVFPNPVENILYLRSTNAQIKSVEIFDIYGRLILFRVINENNFSIEANIFSRGMYYIQINTVDGINSQKFIKL